MDLQVYDGWRMDLGGGFRVYRVGGGVPESR